MLDGLITPPSPSEVASIASFAKPDADGPESGGEEEGEESSAVLEVICGASGSAIQVQRFQVRPGLRFLLMLAKAELIGPIFSSTERVPLTGTRDTPNPSHRLGRDALARDALAQTPRGRRIHP